MQPSRSSGSGSGTGGRANSWQRPTADQLEERLASYPLGFSEYVDQSAEYASFPPVAALFYRLCDANGGWPPHQADFVAAFAELYRPERPELFVTTRWRGTEARVRRAYPSLIREVHLAAMLSDAGLLCLRSDEAAARHGVDLIVISGAYAVRLACFLDTPRGRGWRQAKLRRRPPSGIHLELPLSLEQARRVGEFKLYDWHHANAIVSRISELVRVSSLPELAMTVG
jgi:hypothetical protein